MKKLILTCLMLAVFIGALAISVFAEDIVVSKTEDPEYGTIIQLSANPGLAEAKKYVSTLNKIVDDGTDTDALCVLTDGAETPSYYVFPSSYVVLERSDGKFDVIASQLTDAIAEFNGAKGTNYYSGYATAGSYGDKRIDAMVCFEFTKDVTFVHADWCCLRHCYRLVEVNFKYEISLSSATSMFKGCSILKTVLGFENVDAQIAVSMFNGCNLLETISLPTDITKIPGSMFWGCKKIQILNLDKCTQLTTIGAHAFQDTSYLVFVLPDSVTTIEESAFQSAFKEGNGGSFTIRPTSKLTTIGNSAFEDCRLMPANVYIPSTVTSIGTSAFKKCYTLQTLENFENCKITSIEDGTFQYVSALKTIKIPETVTTIGAAFADNNNLTLVYIPKSVTSIADTFTGGKPTNAIFLYTGKDVSIFASCAKLSSAKIVPASEYDATATYKGINIVVGYSHCIAYLDGVHSDNIVNVKVTSFLEPIKVTSECKDCGVGDETGKIDPLFAFVGYSASESFAGGIVIGFAVDSKAILEYTTLTGNEIEYGVFAVSQVKLDGNDIFDANGNATAGVINAKIASRDFSMFDLKIVGFTSEQMDKKLALGAYVIETKDGKSKYSYLQEKAPGENDKYYFASYNEMMATIK